MVDAVRMLGGDNRHVVDDPLLATSNRFVETFAGDWPLRQAARLNTDAHPWVEFHSPLSHRNGTLLKDATLRDYMQQMMERLESQSLQYETPIGSEPIGARLWQRVVMFPEPPS